MCAWDVDFSYAELDRLATSLVPILQRTGFKPGNESKVAFCLDKSKWTVVALLAVLKAGGVCVPLNPSWPAQQFEAILGDVKPQLILSSPQYQCQVAACRPELPSVPSASRVTSVLNHTAKAKYGWQDIMENEDWCVRRSEGSACRACLGRLQSRQGCTSPSGWPCIFIFM
jgi:non-ribosomal peptide synthetase component F